jgi:hypothetical protein
MHSYTKTQKLMQSNIMIRDFVNDGTIFLGFVFQALTECKMTPIQILVVSVLIFHFLDQFGNMKSVYASILEPFL